MTAAVELSTTSPRPSARNGRRRSSTPRRARRARVYGFIGPNGSGKTTTLRMIMRIFHPDRGGRIRVLGGDHVGRRQRPRRLPARGTRPVQADEGPRRAPLLRRAEGHVATATQAIARLARTDGPGRLGRQEGRSPLQGHGPEGAVHRHRRRPPEAGAARRAVQRPRPGQRRGAPRRGPRTAARRARRSSSRRTTWPSPRRCATSSS